MNFVPQVGRVSRLDGLPGTFAFVPGSDGSVAYGLLVQAAQETRPFDFLAFNSFKVWKTGDEAGLDSFAILLNAFIRASSTFSDALRTCKSGKIPSLGSIVFKDDGPAIVGSTGSGPEAFTVVFDIRTGKLVDNNLHKLLFCTNWEIVYDTPKVGQQVILQISPS